MPETTYTLTWASDDEHPDLAIAEAGLFAHAVASGNDPQQARIHLLAHAPDGVLVGACGGEILWGDFYIDLMWVADAVRGRGIGSALLQRAEAEAAARGCFRIHLDTMSFQAPAFYPRLGYREYARLGGYAGGAERIYFAKELENPSP